MLLEITTTAPNATDLGYLLHKNPANIFERSMGFGTARVFYPEATDERCTAVLWLDLDQASLVRRHGDSSFSLSQYVNDRPYVASSFLSVAMAQSFATALSGRCKERPERVDERWPLSATIPAIDCDAGEEFIRGVFEPLGYEVGLRIQFRSTHKFEDWGASTLYRLSLSSNTTIQQLLTHLYILLPVIDNQKHYSFGEDEVAKLVENASDWLANHPMRDVITKRFLRYKRDFVFDALEKLASNSADEDSVSVNVEEAEDAEPVEKTINLHDQRLNAVAEALKAGGGHRIVDLGCGNGKLLRLLIRDRQWTEILGMDVASRELQIASRRLRLDRDGDSRTERVRLIQGSLLYRDDRIAGYDAAALVEVIEHIELDRLGFLERSVFGYAKPKRVVVTTPNADYNAHWETLHADQFRHADHRFRMVARAVRILDIPCCREFRLFGHSFGHRRSRWRLGSAIANGDF